MGFLKKIDQCLDKATIAILVLSVFMMLLFSVLSIVLRWFGTGIAWTEPLVRHLVFLSAFLGGILATGRGTHIGIDVTAKMVEAKNWHGLATLMSRIISLASFLTLCWLAHASYQFVKVEMEFGKEAFWGLSSGHLVHIIPFGFGTIAFRYLVKLITSFSPSCGKTC